MSSTLTLSVVIATFNERQNIELLLPMVARELNKAGIDHEIIVVDDSSPDGTTAAAESLIPHLPQLRVIVRKDERGLATALQRGFNESRGEFIATLDGDLCHDPRHLPEMLRLVQADRTTVAIGSRYVSGSTFVGKPLIKKLASKVGQIVVRVVLGLPVRDTSNNFRVFSVDLYRRIRNQVITDGNAYLISFLLSAQMAGAHFRELPIQYVERRFGETKLQLGIETRKFFRVLKMMRQVKKQHEDH
jgi:dolichol-phosphate mannosyltransferase